MTVTIPDSHKDLLERPILVALATLMPDNQPQVTPVWCAYDGTYLLVVTGKQVYKHRNMQQRKQVSILVIDPDNGGRWLEVRGMVEEVTEQGALEQLDALTLKYVGKPNYYGSVEPLEEKEHAQLALHKIRPVRVNTSG